MGQVQTDLPTIGIPSTVADPDIATAGIAGFSQGLSGLKAGIQAGNTAAAGLGDLGQSMVSMAADINGAMKRASRTDELARFTIQSQTDLLDKRQSIKENPTPQTVDEFKNWGKEYLNNALAGASDPAVAAGMKQHWATHYLTALAGVMGEQRKAEISQFSANVDVGAQQSVANAVAAPDQLTKDQTRDSFFANLDRGQQAGYILPAKVQMLKDNWGKAVSVGMVYRDMATDPQGTFNRLGDPGKYYPGVDDETALQLRGKATGEIHRVQNDNYQGVVQGILGAAYKNTQMPYTTDQILDMSKNRALSIPQAKDCLAFIEGTSKNADNTDNPKSYVAMSVRLTDPDNPLTREEFLKNYSSGEWQLSARTVGTVLSSINRSDNKLEKTEDTAVKSRVAYWKTQFGNGTKEEEFATGLGQIQQLRDAGTLGSDVDEINKAIDGIMKPQQSLYNIKWGMGNTAKPPQDKRWFFQKWGDNGQPAQPNQGISNSQGWMNPNLRGSK